MASLPYTATVVLLVTLIAFVPPLVYLAGIRNLERYRREPWLRVLQAFGWGAVGAVVLAILLEGVFATGSFKPPTLRDAIWLGVMVAPAVEEFTKVVGLGLVRDRDPEPEDGLVYGAAAGFGFAATENLFYQGVALLGQGWEAYVGTVVVRTVASALLHGAASALVGYAIWQWRGGTGTAGGIFALYVVAVALHGFYNYVADFQNLIAFLAATVLSLTVFFYARRRIVRLDRAQRLV